MQTTGSRGLHVVAPIVPGPDNDEVLAFAHTLADQLAASDPGRLTTEFRKAKRGARLYLDVARNGYAQTVVAPYSRARAAARAATGGTGSMSDVSCRWTGTGEDASNSAAPGHAGA